ncbi:MAG TPA: hypothetical protein VFG92_04360 [Agromyces sp.]|nr:hypothetical protein [Agromyces sp.]
MSTQPAHQSQQTGRTNRRRIPVVVATTALALATVGIAAPAQAADGNVGVSVMLASPDFFGMAGGETPPEGIIEVFDATGDGSAPILTVPATGGQPFGTEVWFDLPDGQYKVLASVDGYLPSWAGSVSDGGADAEVQVLELIDDYHGFSAPLTFSNAAVVDVAADDESVDAPAHVGVLAGRSTAYIGGMVFSEDSAAAEQADVALYRVGQGTPLLTQATDRGAYVLDAVPPGNYQLRFTVNGVDQWWPFEADRSRAQVLNMPQDGGAWVALDGGFATPVASDPGQHLAIVGDPVEGGVLSLQANLPDPFDDPNLRSTDRLSAITWYLDGIAIPSATGASLVVPTEAVGGAITASAVAVQLLGYFRTAISSAPVGPVAASALEQISPAPMPVIVGTPQVGVQLTTTLGAWAAGTTRTFQWSRDGVPIAGATGRNYVPKGTDAGGTLTFTVTGSLDGFQTTVRTSDPTAVVADGVFGTPSAALKTDRMATAPRVGDAMRAVHGAWTPGAETWAYQWLRDGVLIDGATGEYYTVEPGDLGSTLSAQITGSRLGYETAAVESIVSGVVTEGLFVAPRPVITPAPQVGVELSADLGTWSPAPDSLTYRWMRGTTVLGTGEMYTPTPADAGRNLRVVVTGSKDGYLDAQRASVAVAVLP